MLRKKGVVGKFVEFYGAGPGGAAAGRPGHHRQHGPRVRRHLRHLPRRCRDAALPASHRPARRRRSSCVEAYCKEQGLFHTRDTPEAVYTDTLELDLGTRRAEPGRPDAAAGSRRLLQDVKQVVRGGAARAARRSRRSKAASHDRRRPGQRRLRAARRRPAARASSTARWSSPPSPAAPTRPTRRCMIAAGLLAKKAVERGLHDQAVGEDQPRARLEGRHRLPRSRPA